MNTFKFVIIVSENISRTYFNAIKKIDQAEIVGVISRSGRKPEGVVDNI